MFPRMYAIPMIQKQSATRLIGLLTSVSLHQLCWNENTLLFRRLSNPHAARFRDGIFLTRISTFRPARANMVAK